MVCRFFLDVQRVIFIFVYRHLPFIFIFCVCGTILYIEKEGGDDIVTFEIYLMLLWECLSCFYENALAIFFVNALTIFFA